MKQPTLAHMPMVCHHCSSKEQDTYKARDFKIKDNDNALVWEAELGTRTCFTVSPGETATDFILYLCPSGGIADMNVTNQPHCHRILCSCGPWKDRSVLGKWVQVDLEARKLVEGPRS